jgi:Periplasmic binding proteins and sugar binding domain of LacI family
VGCAVLASNLVQEPGCEHQVVANLILRRVNGLLIVPTSYDQSYLQPLQRSGTPVVFLDRQPIPLSADSVVSDCEAGSYAAVSRLVSLGHRRIGFLGESIKHGAAKRYAGYVGALSEFGIPVDPGSSGVAPIRSSRQPPPVRRCCQSPRRSWRCSQRTSGPPSELFKRSQPWTVGRRGHWWGLTTSRSSTDCGPASRWLLTTPREKGPSVLKCSSRGYQVTSQR